MTCTAHTCGTTRPILAEAGWICDGTDLAIAVPAGTTLPVAVIRRDLIPYVDDVTAEFNAESGWPDFTGGDHLHLRIPIPLVKPRVSAA